MKGRQSIFRVIDPFLLAVSAIALLGVGVLIGVLIEEGESSAPGTLQASEIGNAKDGRELFVSQGCAMCHTYEGRGGTDAPDLDFMRGKLTANDVANMSGLIWNHVPTMKAAFAEEGIPFPEFTGNQMASLIAYLHGGGPPPNVKPEASGEMHMGGEPGDEESGGAEKGGEATGGNAQEEAGAQVFASNGCGSCHAFKAANSTGTVGPDLNEYLAPDDDKAGIEEMIVDPNSEIAEGFSANVMPQTYGKVISKKELEQLVQFLIKNSPAGGGKPEGPGGEEHDVGGPSS
jgi:cytochrome c551/c552